MNRDKHSKEGANIRCRNEIFSDARMLVLLRFLWAVVISSIDRSLRHEVHFVSPGLCAVFAFVCLAAWVHPGCDEPLGWLYSTVAWTFPVRLAFELQCSHYMKGVARLCCCYEHAIKHVRAH